MSCRELRLCKRQRKQSIYKNNSKSQSSERLSEWRGNEADNKRKNYERKEESGDSLTGGGVWGGSGGVWGGCGGHQGVLQKKFPASPFPQLCKGLIKYAWCLEQSRGKWDSTNSTGSAGRPVPLQRSPAASPLPPHEPRHPLPPTPTTLVFCPTHPRAPLAFRSYRSHLVCSSARRSFIHSVACPPRASVSLVFVLIRNDSPSYFGE